jgi:hypothetical protein
VPNTSADTDALDNLGHVSTHVSALLDGVTAVDGWTTTLKSA